MAFLNLDNCSLNLPVYGASNRSLKQMMLSSVTGGRIASDSHKLTVVKRCAACLSIFVPVIALA